MGRVMIRITGQEVSVTFLYEIFKSGERAM